MDLTDYLEPVSEEAEYRLGEKTAFGKLVKMNLLGKGLPGWEKSDIAILGVSEYRGSGKKNDINAADNARKYLYQLTRPDEKMNISDLGNLKEGRSIEDSYAALRDVLTELMKNNTLPVVIGGGRDITLPMFRAYEAIMKTINLTAIDNRAGMVSDHFGNDFLLKSYLNKIIESRSKHLFNYTSIGNQACFTGPEETRLLDELLFDSIRLGIARENIRETEPVLRDTDLLMISMSSIRQADAPASLFPSPNGFNGEEVCQLAWYGGKSERLSSLALVDWHGEYDDRDQTAHQVAQIAWYFIDGYYKRKGEYPFNPAKECTKYIVNISGSGNEIIFYKSGISERWWMEVPSSRLPKSLLVACSHEDYQRACRQEVPERWWQNYRKINH
jgi:formiminoglutamase